MLALADSGSPFDLAFGLPLHPLAVHVPVVLLPLGALGVLLVLLVPRWRTLLAWPVIAVTAGVTVWFDPFWGLLAGSLAELARFATVRALGRDVRP